MTTTDTERPLRRSLLFVPGDDPRKLERSREAGADTLLLDLEDSVAPAGKEAARACVIDFLSEGDFGGAEAAVRINPMGTPFFEPDLEACAAAGARTLMLPKSERHSELGRVAEGLQQLESARAGAGAPIRLLALVETALGIANAGTLPMADARVDGLCFGHADFSRDMGLVDPPSDRGLLHHARCSLVIAARAGDVAAVDTVFLDVRDADGFRTDAELGAGLGFEGKLCIHPAQVPIANEVFSPGPAQIDYALRVLAEAQRAEAEGRGVFTVDGKMVDEPVIVAQRLLVARARRLGLVPGAEEQDG